MNPADRAHLLRARFRALGGLPYYRDLKPAKQAKPAVPARKPDRPFGGIPFSIYPREFNSEWVTRPDAAKTVLLRLSNRRARQSALTRIATQLPPKLVKLEPISAAKGGETCECPA